MPRLIICVFLLVLGGCNTIPWATRNTWSKLQDQVLSDPPSSDAPPAATARRWAVTLIGVIATPFTLAYDFLTFPIQLFAYVGVFI
jgi:hypothetical protein